MTSHLSRGNSSSKTWVARGCICATRIPPWQQPTGCPASQCTCCPTPNIRIWPRSPSCAVAGHRCPCQLGGPLFAQLFVQTHADGHQTLLPLCEAHDSPAARRAARRIKARMIASLALLIVTIACKRDAPRLSTKRPAPWGTTAPKRRWLRWAAANACDAVRDDMARTKPRREGVGKAEPHVVRRLFTSVG